jgi:hypothetical protein
MQLGPESTDKWIPPGKPVEVQGYTIRSGMFYLGSCSPVAVDPGLPVSPPEFSTAFYATPELSYQTLSPGQRGGYLDWLAHDRSEPIKLPILYLQLFFQGLERRLFLDQDYDLELGAAAAGLLFRYRAAQYELPIISFLHFFGFFSGWEWHCVLLDWLLGNGHHVATEPELALVLSSLAQANRTLEAALACDLVLLHPERSPRSGSATVQSSVRAGFIERFTARFPTGFALKPAAETKGVYYRPHSPNLARDVRMASGRLLLTWDVPDIWTANGGFGELVQLWNELTLEATSPKLSVNATKLKALAEETCAIQGTLATRLRAGEEDLATTPPIRPKITESQRQPGEQLQPRYRPILRQLVQQQQWTRQQFARLAKQQGFMPSGLIQDLNNWSVEVFQDRLLVGEEPISVNLQLINQIKTQYE